jgi:hypothetical protein
MVLASIEPVSCAVGGVVGDAYPERQEPENELPSSVVASKTSCSVTSDGPRPLGGRNTVQKYATAKLDSLLGIVMVTVPDVRVPGVKAPEPILVATAVGVTPVMVNVTVVGAPPPVTLVGAPPPRFPEPPGVPQLQTNAAERTDRKRRAALLRIDSLATSVSEKGDRP